MRITLHKPYAALALVALMCLGAVQLRASDPGKGDWPMWGGTPDRNQVSNMKNVPTRVGREDEEEHQVGRRSRVAELRQPVVANGMVFVGTNNELARDPKQGGDRGVLMAFRESDGQFMWQQTHPKLEAGAPTTGHSRVSPAHRSSKARSSIT
jgi:outer membrane protein assembly factor BamB